MPRRQQNLATLRSEVFAPTFSAKTIYVYNSPDAGHDGLLKIGDASVKGLHSLDGVMPNAPELDAAAKMGPEIISGLLDSIHKATTERREYTKTTKSRVYRRERPMETMSNSNLKLAGMRIKKTEEAGCVPGGYLIEPDNADNLPSEANQVKYFEMIAPKLYTLDFKGDDLPRIQKLLSEHDPELTSRIVPLRTTVSIEEFRLIVPETLLGILTKKEQDSAELFVPPTQIQYRVPVLYRFIKRRYAKELIDEGKLRISSFERCRKCEGGCGERFDQGEGKGTFSIQAGDITGEFVLQAGGNPLMLCMALSPCARRAKDDVCIEIFDLFALIAAISTGLADKGITIKRIMHGPCSYAERLFVRKSVKSRHDFEKLLDQIKSGTGGFDFNLCGRIPLNEVGEQHYFTKPMKFADEHEYRIVWDCDCVPEDGKVDIVLENVQSFCQLYKDPCAKVKQRRTESGIECTKRKKMRSSRRKQG